MPIYTCTGAESANAFDRVNHFMVNGAVSKERKKLYTLSGTINYAVGHNKAVMLIARHLVASRLENKSAKIWLFSRGVKLSDLEGTKGFKNVQVWKGLWAEKLAEEFNSEPDKIHTLEYPF